MEKETKTPRTTIARIDLSGEEDYDLNVSVVISWGYNVDGDLDEDLQEDPIEYVFGTKREAKAFLAGATDAIEWFSFKLVQDVTVDYEDEEKNDKENI